jgi:hypothetical protein
MGKTAAITAKVASIVGLPHLVDCLDGDDRPVAALVLRQMKMPHDVLNHHNGVIDQDADGENQSEERMRLRVYP